VKIEAIQGTQEWAAQKLKSFRFFFAFPRVSSVGPFRGERAITERADSGVSPLPALPR
jgi:hypothetical protein